MLSEELRLLLIAVFVVAAVTVLLHERHYQIRREQVLDTRLQALSHRLTALEDTWSESRGK